MLFDPNTTPTNRRLNFTALTTSRRTENRLDGNEMVGLTSDMGYLCRDDLRRDAIRYVSEMKSLGVDVPMQRPVLSDETLITLMSALTELMPYYKYYAEYEQESNPYKDEIYYTKIVDCIKSCLCDDEFAFIYKLCLTRHSMHMLTPLSLVDIRHSRWLIKEGMFYESRSSLAGTPDTGQRQIRGSLVSVLTTFNYMRNLFNLDAPMKRLKGLAQSNTHLYAGDGTLSEVGSFMQETRQRTTIAMALAVLTAPISSDAIALHKAVALHMYLGEDFSSQTPTYYKEGINRTPLAYVFGDLSLSTGNLHFTHDITIPMSLLIVHNMALTKSSRDASDAEQAPSVFTPKYKMLERVVKNPVQHSRKIPFELTTTQFNSEKAELFSQYGTLPPAHISLLMVSDPICKYTVPFFLGVGVDTSLVAFTPATRRALTVLSTLYSKYGNLPLRDPLAAHHIDSEALSNPENAAFPETFCATMDLLNSVSNSKFYYVDKKANAYVHLPNMYLGLTDINSVLFGVPSLETQSDHNMWHTFTVKPKRNIDYSPTLKIHRTYYF